MEKLPLKSKKFIAFLLAEMTWKLVIIIALLVFKSHLEQASAFGWWFLITVVICAAFIEVGFIGGQAWLDRFVRVAEITTNGAPKPSAGAIPTPKPEEKPDAE
jgi:hypothetical protein